MGTILVGAVLGGIVVAIIAKIDKDKKKGKCGGCENCERGRISHGGTKAQREEKKGKRG
jgi:hypothetical protein